MIGMALGALMTIPTASQLTHYQGIVGSHIVGASADGATMPILGWSLEHGDLRIPHFVGMHALQILPLVLLGLELAAHRVPVLRDGGLRLRIMRVVIVGYCGMTGIILWQALIGQPIVAPAGPVLLAAIVLTVGVATAISVCVARAVRAQPRIRSLVPVPEQRVVTAGR